MAISRAIINSIDRRLSIERGAVFKGHGGRIRVVLIYPNSYHIGMSNLGLQGIYGMLNSRDDVVCERAFMPDIEQMEEHRRTNSPICAYESKTPIGHFDIAAFSLSFENDYPNVIKILAMSGIPIRTADRTERHPLLIAGGACCFFNPEPVAEVFDIIFIGEAEETLTKFLGLYNQCGASDRRHLKEEALNIEGLYIPEFYSVNYSSSVWPLRVKSLNHAPSFIKRVFYKGFVRETLCTRIRTPETEFADMHLLEVMRGCYWRCRFCLVSAVYGPPRLRSKDFIRAELEKLSTPVGLIAPSLSDIPYIADLIAEGKAYFSITSLRANEASLRLVGLLKGKRSLSIAPEAGTERMRAVINKGITEQEILSIAGHILNSGIDTLRLYFMIGLPTEGADDIEGIVKLTEKIRSLGTKGKIALTISIFVPKPFTAFQWHGFSDIREARDKLSFIKKRVQAMRNVRVSHDAPKTTIVQAALARGGRELLESIIAIGMTDSYDAIVKDPAIKRRFTTPWGIDMPLPWDFIDSGISKESLWKEYQQAINPKTAINHR